METKLKPYSEYKTASVSWSDQCPASWEVVRIKSLLRETDDRTNTGTETLLSLRQSRGLVPHNEVSKKPIAPSALVGYKRVRPGDLVVNRMRAATGVIAAATEPGLVSPDYAVFRPRRRVSIDYLVLLFTTPHLQSLFRAESKGLGTGSSGFLRLYSEDLGAVKITLPAFDEQREIAGFCGEQNRRFSRLTLAKQRLIALLNEQKQTIIQRAVTSGLDPDVPLKPSRVDWVGHVPAHWDVVPLKRIARLKSGDSITALQFRDSGTYPVYGGNGLRGYTESYTHEGDHVLIGRQGALCGNINYAHGRFWASEHAVVATLVEGYDLVWFGELVRTMNLNQYSQSAAQPGLSVERIQNIRAPLPPAREQGEIAEYIRQETEGLDAAIKQAKEQIRLIREYRARLIADVVTGRLDIRGVTLPAVENGAIGVPGSPPDAEPLLEEEAFAYADD